MPTAPKSVRIGPTLPRVDNRPSPAKRGYGRRWRDASAAFLLKHPWCACGCGHAAECVDHIVPVTGGDDPLFWDSSNWQPLSNRCHSRKTSAWQAEDALWPLVVPRLAGKSAVPVTIVCGPPGSGKSAYVEANRLHGDIVIDLDGIKSELSGLPQYYADDCWLGPALRERNARLDALSTDHMGGMAWFIDGAPSLFERRYWAKQLGAGDVFVLDVDADECQRRIAADARRHGSITMWRKAIDQWWKVFRATKGN